MSATTQPSVSRNEFCSRILKRVSSDLSMIIDREFLIVETSVELANKRAEGRNIVHISFRIGFKTPEGHAQGCILIPLPDALTLSAYLMMAEDDVIESHRTRTSLDETTKEALLELGNFAGGASDAVVRGLFPEGYSARFEGCQGVREDIRPVLDYAEGDDLVIARSRAQIGNLPAFDLIMILPMLSALPED